MKNYFCLCMAIFIALQLQAQSLSNFSCYTVANNSGTSNALFKYNESTTNKWVEIGSTNTNNIKAIATDPINNVIYAVNEDNFGKINAETGLFVSINSIGVASGDIGEIDLNNIEGLTYNSTNGIIYATHRIESGPLCEPIENSNDLLFQIDITTGQFIPDAMIDSNGNWADYAVIESAFVNTMLDVCGNNEYLYDVNDIAFNAYSGELYAIQNQGLVCGVSILDTKDGSVEAVLHDLEEMDAVSLSFSPFGELFCTTGNDAENHLANCFKFIDLQYMGTYDISLPDPTGAHQDFKGMDFFSARNDLALKLDLDTDVYSSVVVGDTVEFSVTLYNQGEVDNVNILVTNYIPSGLTLYDSNWTAVPGTSSAEFMFAGPLLANTDTTIPIKFIVDSDFTGSKIKNYAEISNSYSTGISDANSDLLPLPDIDSEPNATNNELMLGHTIIDNVTDQKGPDANEDEDDHDVASITIVQPVGNFLFQTTIEPASCNGFGSAEIEMLDSGVAPFTHKWLDNFGNLNHLATTDNSIHQINDLDAGTYNASITDAAGNTSFFDVTISTLADAAGNVNCGNCPEHLVTPDNTINGSFKAKTTIEINGYVDGSTNTEFLMCD